MVCQVGQERLNTVKKSKWVKVDRTLSNARSLTCVPSGVSQTGVGNNSSVGKQKVKRVLQRKCPTGLGKWKFGQIKVDWWQSKKIQTFGKRSSEGKNSWLRKSLKCGLLVKRGSFRGMTSLQGNLSLDESLWGLGLWVLGWLDLGESSTLVLIEFDNSIGGWVDLGWFVSEHNIFVCGQLIGTRLVDRWIKVVDWWNNRKVKKMLI